MGAYFGGVVTAFLLWILFGDTLKNIAQQLKRIAVSLENKKNDNSSEEPE